MFGTKMAPKKSLKRKRMSARDSETPQPNKMACKPRGPNFSAPTEMVTFFIGKEGSDEKFLVHKEFVCHHSPVLAAAFNSNFMEGETQTYRLEDINPSVFRLLVQWFYRQRLYVFEQEDIECPDDKNDPEIEKLLAAQDLDLVQLWVVADKLLIRPLQNAVIAVLEDFWEQPYARRARRPTSWIQYVYDHTSVGSPLRDFAVDVCAYNVTPEGFAKAPDDFPKEVLLDMAIVLSKAMEDFAPKDDDDAARIGDTDSHEQENANDNDGVWPGIPNLRLNPFAAVHGDSEDEDESSNDDSPLLRGGLIRTLRTHSVPEDE